MFIRTYDIEPVCKKMEAEIAAGNTWMAYQAGDFISGRGDLFFFRSEEETHDYCIANYSDYDRFTGRAMQPLLEALQERVKQDRDREDIGYYFVNGRHQVDVTLKVNPDQNPLYDPDGNAFTDALFKHWDNPQKEIRAEKLFTVNDASQEANLKLNITIMNQENLSYLQNNLKYAGFGDALNTQLEANVSKGLPDFTLNHTSEYNNRKLEATLHFRKGDQNDIYFFNKYDAKLIKGDGSEKEQTFFMDKGKGITVKEAVNLLDGRSVNKDFTKENGEKYNAWVKLDFDNKNDYGNYEVKRFHSNFGYELEKAIGKLGLKFEGEQEKDDLMRSLKKGNLQAATDTSGERVFVAADPESGKTNQVKLYDKSYKEVTTEMRNVEQQPVAQSKDAKQRGVGADESVSEKKTEVSKGKKTGDDGEDLLEKKTAKKGRQKVKAGDDDDLISQNKSGQSQGRRR